MDRFESVDQKGEVESISGAKNTEVEVRFVSWLLSLFLAAGNGK